MNRREQNALALSVIEAFKRGDNMIYPKTYVKAMTSEMRHKVEKVKKAIGKWRIGKPPRTWRQLCRSYGNRCLCCGRKEGQGFDKLTRDHVIPKSKGGDGSLANSQPLCGHCNARKQDQTIDFRDVAKAGERLLWGGNKGDARA